MGKKTAPVEFSEDICLAVCGHIFLGLSLRKIEAIDGMPTKSAVMMWLLQGEAFKAAGDDTNPKTVFVVQTQLGHKRPGVTELYTAFDPAYL